MDTAAESNKIIFAVVFVWFNKTHLINHLKLIFT